MHYLLKLFRINPAGQETFVNWLSKLAGPLIIGDRWGDIQGPHRNGN